MLLMSIYTVIAVLWQWAHPMALKTRRTEALWDISECFSRVFNLRNRDEFIEG